MFVVMVLYGLIGLAIGALVRNQIVAVIAALVWLTAAEHLLIDALPAGRAVDTRGATFGLLQLGPTVTTRGTLLAAPIGWAAPPRVHRRGGRRSRSSSRHEGTSSDVETYQHVLPGMQADAARVPPKHPSPLVFGANPARWKAGEHPGEHPRNPVERTGKGEGPGR